MRARHCIAATFILYDPPKDKEKQALAVKQFDYLGAIACSGGLVLILIAMIQAVVVDPVLSQPGNHSPPPSQISPRVQSNVTVLSQTDRAPTSISPSSHLLTPPLTMHCIYLCTFLHTCTLTLGSIAGLVVGGCICGLIFIVDQFYTSDPLIPPSIFHNRIFR